MFKPLFDHGNQRGVELLRELAESLEDDDLHTQPIKFAKQLIRLICLIRPICPTATMTEKLIRRTGRIFSTRQKINFGAIWHRVNVMALSTMSLDCRDNVPIEPGLVLTHGESATIKI
jgi:hypothetical protein